MRQPAAGTYTIRCNFITWVKIKFDTTNAGAATQRHLVNRGSLGLVPARTHVVLVATTRCASDNNGE